MASELQELRELVDQLRAEKEQLLQEQAVANSPRSGMGADPDSGSPLGSQHVGHNNSVPSERVLYIPRERKCPTFRGTSGILVEDWVEEMKATLRARHLRPVDQAYFIYDHLDGEAKAELRYRPRAEREDPKRILAILQDMYGCAKSYVSLQQNFFSRKQQDGESLQEFSHALCCIMEKIERCSPHGVRSASTFLRDQFVEHVLDFNLRRELKRVVRQHPDYILLEVRAEAIRWEREGRPDEPRGRSYSVPSLSAMQCSGGVASDNPGNSEMADLKQMLLKQQEQLNQLTQGLLALQTAPWPPANLQRPARVICRRCQKPGHYARECGNSQVDSQGWQLRAPLPITATSVAQEAGNFFPLM